MEILEKLNAKIWDPNFWLPQGSSWKEIFEYTRFDFYSLVLLCSMCAVVIYIIRIIFEKYIASPIGKYFNIKERELFKANHILEPYFDKNRIITDSVVLLISKDTGIEFDEVKNWLRIRRAVNKPSQLEKFNESAWKFTFYLSMWIFGLYVLYDKEWTWDTRKAWVNYPRQHMDNDIFVYYTIEISFYFSLLVSQFYDVRRKDFWQMFLHHIVTLSLLLFSMMCNFQRIGSLVIVLHDFADPYLEFAKMGAYCKLKKLCDPAFVGFMLAWLITRLIMFPLLILNSTTFEAREHFVAFPAYWYFNILLYILQVMHVIWFYMILRVAYKAIFNGVTADDRSESSDEDPCQEHQHKE